MSPELEEDDLIQIEQAIPRLTEAFIDSVFDLQSILPRSEFLRRLARSARWIFNAEAIRDKLQIVAIDTFQEEQE